MVPFYFGEAEKQLFGVYYPPSGERIRQVGVLLSPPIAHEHIRTHMAIRQVAQLLSEGGYHVLKFDYFGVGDSYGGSEQGSVGQWKRDIATACSELGDISGVRHFSLVGVRLGASMALEIAPEIPGVQEVVLWDPVVSGREYLDALRHISGANGESQSTREGGVGEEILGFPFSPEMILSISEIDLLNGSVGFSGRAHLVLSAESPEHARLREKMAISCAGVETTVVDEHPGWEKFPGHDEVLVANHWVRSIGSLFTR